MIVKTHYQPHSYSANFNLSNATASANVSFKNKLTGNIINVQQSNVDFHILGKEMALLREIRAVPSLAAIADVNAHPSPNARLQSAGMAVTFISNRVEGGKAKENADRICDNNPRNQAVDINVDDAMPARGKGFIQGFMQTQTPLDATHYAIGLRLGSDMKKSIFDPMMVGQFNSIWNTRLARQ